MVIPTRTLSPVRLALVGAGALALVAMGVGAGYWAFKPAPAKPETYAPEIRQRDNSLVLERKPQADVKPAHVLPPKAVLERKVQITVKPKAAPVVNNETGLAECPPVAVDLSLVKMPDSSRRVIASSPDGEVIAGVDVPVLSTIEQPRRWAAGVYLDPQTKERGVFLDRDFGRVRTGVELGQTRDARAGSSVTARVKVGFTF